jgi:hypothetical protein
VVVQHLGGLGNTYRLRRGDRRWKISSQNSGEIDRRRFDRKARRKRPYGPAREIGTLRINGRGYSLKLNAFSSLPFWGLIILRTVAVLDFSQTCALAYHRCAFSPMRTSTVLLRQVPVACVLAVNAPAILAAA